MARISKFQLQNFRGIDLAEIDIDQPENAGRVITLLGLNECGKTTILEGISNFVSKDTQMSYIFTKDGNVDPGDMIPLKSISNFNGSIQIRAKISLSESDIQKVLRVSKEKGVHVDPASISREFFIYQEFIFEDSAHTATNNIWDFKLEKANKRAKKKSSRAILPHRGGEQGPDIWRLCVSSIRETLPKVAFFPTFLVEIPERIYLQKVAGEAKASPYYRTIIQEILQSIDNKLSIEKHILERVSSFKAANQNKFLGYEFAKSQQYRQINALMQDLSTKLSKEILESWQLIFDRPLGFASVSVSWDVDVQNNEAPFLSIELTDGMTPYRIDERSLGFRWFFAFLLFTKFKQSEDKKYIFLLDEPAANLHAKAQQELLKAFEYIARNNILIYSTHSHHMIEPKWLSNAYIIQNSAIDFDSVDEMPRFSKRDTNIKAIKYRNFASQENSNRTSYFQPVIERLQYIPPNIVGGDPFVIFEGITDYHIFKSLSNSKYDQVSFIPGSGAGSLAPLISLLIGRGSKFCIVLDDDSAGRKAMEIYQKSFNLGNDSVFTIAQVNSSFKNYKLEDLIDEASKKNFSNELGIDPKLNKKLIRNAILELSAIDKLEGCLSSQTIEKLEEVLDKATSVF